MGFLDLPTLATVQHTVKQKWEGVPSVVARKVKKSDAKKLLQFVYGEVDKRDGLVCWVTGRKLAKRAQSGDELLTHHHLAGRNVMPEWVYLPERIISVSLTAHRLITAGLIEVEGDDARKPIRFHWRAGTPVSSRVITIQSRRATESR